MINDGDIMGYALFFKFLDVMIYYDDMGKEP